LDLPKKREKGETVIKTFDTLYFHTALKGHARAEELVRRIPHRRLEETANLGKFASPVREDSREIARQRKYSIALAPYPGRMVEGCPATEGMRCCRYRVINLVAGCPFDCSYCILEGYLNRPTIFIFPELEKAFEEVDREIDTCRKYPLRFGTGELTDSLALDHFTGFSLPLVEFFRKRPQAWFEFKTKSASVDNLCRMKNIPSNILVSWSLNPQAVIDTEEKLSPSLMERLDAAVRVRDAGYHLGFHFDPIFYFPGWEEAYCEVVAEIYRRVRPGDVAWISLGCLRYSSWLAPYLARKYRSHPLLAGELFPVPPDGKYRYPQPLRIEIYRKMYRWISQFDRAVYVYLCMESATVYRWALGRKLMDDPLAVEKGFPQPSACRTCSKPPC
jgi:spore photoproduct lyase